MMHSQLPLLEGTAVVIWQEFCRTMESNHPRPLIPSLFQWSGALGKGGPRGLQGRCRWRLLIHGAVQHRFDVLAGTGQPMFVKNRRKERPSHAVGQQALAVHPPTVLPQVPYSASSACCSPLFAPIHRRPFAPSIHCQVAEKQTYKYQTTHNHFLSSFFLPSSASTLSLPVLDLGITSNTGTNPRVN